MVKTESITIQVPVEMRKYLEELSPESELRRNVLLLYPYILNQSISYGRAAEILVIGKSELLDIYDKLGYSYLDLIQDELEEDIDTYLQLKKKG